MIYVSIQYENSRSYIQSTDYIIAGEAFYQNRLYKEEELLSLISTWESEEQFIEGLKNLNGFYTLIKHNEHELYAAVDRVRSIPLFYGQKGNDFYLSDSAEWIRRKLGNQEMDTLAREEFLLTGYVTGPYTLFPDVKQLQAGEAITLEDTKQGLAVKIVPYYRFLHEHEQDKHMEDLLEEYDQVLLRVFNRLIQRADGRTIVVPLSGGYDSRLIVLMLKRLGYNKLLAFSYGRSGNTESVVSKRVADSLGIEWEFIEYTNTLWYQWYHSDKYREYIRFAHGCTSLPHIQDWPAVLGLKESNRIPQDSIFVPGHTPMLSLSGKPKQNEPFETAILMKHYSLNYLKEDLSADMKNRIHRYEGIEEIDNYYIWECIERQTKFIANSIRTYEFFDYDWYLPFWDKENVDFCSKLPKTLMDNKILFKKYVNRLTVELISEQLPTTNDSVKNRIRKAITSRLQVSLKAKLKGLLKSSQVILTNEYNSHPMAWWGIYSVDEYLMKGKYYRSINSALVTDLIDYWLSKSN